MDWTHEQMHDKLNRLLIMVGDINRMLKNKNKESNVIHAKWEINSDGYYPYCSHCKNEPENGKMTKWCSECGARMDKE